MTTTRPDAPSRPSPGFAARLRVRTRAAHGTAESGGVLAALIEGRGDTVLYRALLEQLHPVYAALEEAADVMRAHPVAGRFAAAELTRLPSLEADLRWFSMRPGATEVLPETARYVRRLRQVAAVSGTAFVAHHYTRYLGDLSGGQAVGAAVRRHLGLDAPDGRRFYVFDGIDRPAQFKDSYRAQLDAAPWDEREREAVIAETLLAYRLSADLEAGVGRLAASRRAAR